MSRNYRAEEGDTLTPREAQVLTMLADRPLKEVAAHLGIGYQTAKTYASTAYAKIGADRLVDAYVKLGWLRVPR